MQASVSLLALLTLAGITGVSVPHGSPPPRKGQPQSRSAEVAWACAPVQSLKSCPRLEPVDSSPPGSSVRGISQPRILEWAAIFSSRGSSRPRDPARVFCVSLPLSHRGSLIYEQASMPKLTLKPAIQLLRSLFFSHSRVTWNGLKPHSVS